MLAHLLVWRALIIRVQSIRSPSKKKRNSVASEGYTLLLDDDGLSVAPRGLSPIL